MKGFLSKQGHVVKSWQVRFFVLKDSELFYYVDYTATKLKGKISLPGSFCVVQTIEMEGRENCFVIKTPQKELILSAPSPQERQNWIDAIVFVTKGILDKPNKEDKLRAIRLENSGWLEKKRAQP